MRETPRQLDALVIGGQGLIGGSLATALQSQGRSWRGTYCRRPAPGLIPLDLGDGEAVARCIAELHPRVVFHCANLAGGVDFCERNPKPAELFHLEGTRSLGTACRAAGATLVFISTDYVFDGRHGPYGETDPARPLNVYGRLKLAAEEWVRQHVPQHVIVRTTNVFGWDPASLTPNFTMSLYRQLRERKAMAVPSYLWGTPTYVADLAAALLELADKDARSTFHIVGPSYLSRYDWARAACDVLGLDAGLLQATAQPPADMVPRPLRSHLSTAKFTAAYATPLHEVTHGLQRMRAEMNGAMNGAPA